MGRFRLTSKANADMDGIAEYTLSRWGGEQLARYIDGLEACFQLLADDPALGRRCDEIRQGLLRWEQGRHVVFFRRKAYGIRVIRILHDRMLPGRHDLDDEEEGA